MTEAVRHPLKAVATLALDQRPHNLKANGIKPNIMGIRSAIRAGENIINLYQAGETEQLPREATLSRFEEIMEQRIHPDVRLVMGYLNSQLQTELAALGHAALTAYGSGVGAMYIRELAGTTKDRAHEPQDIDMLFMLDGYLSHPTQQLEDLHEKITRLMTDPQDPRIPKGYKQCTFMFPGSPLAERINATDDNLRETFERHDFTDANARQILGYFFPSFPPEINHKNRQTVLRALDALEPNQRSKIVNALLDEWGNENGLLFPIDMKHFGISKNSDPQLISRYQEVAKQISIINRTMLNDVLTSK